MTSTFYADLLFCLWFITKSQGLIVPFVVPQTENIPLFNWTAVSPSSQLEYHPCYDGYHCARLRLPMDWNKISDSRSVAIAIFKLPAAVSTTDSRFRGTLVSNLGGPGQSGVQMVLGAGSFIRELVDDEDHKYGLVSFDPRGVWQSTPSLDCFEGDDYARGLWEWEKRIMGNLDGSNQAAIQAHIAAAKAFGGFCENKKHGFAEHVSTAAIARDMLEIVDKIESERKEQSSHLDQELLSTGPAAPITVFGVLIRDAPWKYVRVLISEPGQKDDFGWCG